MDWVKTYPNEVSNWWVHEYGCHSYSPHIKFLGFSRETIHVEHLAMLLWTTMREFFPTSNMVIKYFGTSYISLDLVLNLFCGCKSNHQNKDPSPLTHGLSWTTSILCHMVSRKHTHPFLCTKQTLNSLYGYLVSLSTLSSTLVHHRWFSSIWPSGSLPFPSRRKALLCFPFSFFFQKDHN